MSDSADASRGQPGVTGHAVVRWSIQLCFVLLASDRDSGLQLLGAKFGSVLEMITPSPCRPSGCSPNGPRF